MSVQAITWAFAYTAPSSSAKLVLLALANYADEHGVCWPSVARLGQDTGLKDRAVRYALKALEDAGALSKVERRRADGTRSSDEYSLNLQVADNAARAAIKRQNMQEQAAPNAGHEPVTEPSDIKPLTPLSVVAEQIRLLQPTAYRRSSQPEVLATLEGSVKRGECRAAIFRALRAYYAGPDQRREGGRYAKAAHRMIQRDRWKNYLPTPPPPPKPATPQQLAQRLRHYADTGEWMAAWGPKPEPARQSA